MVEISNSNYYEVSDMDDSKPSEQPKVSNEELERMAAEELLKEAKQLAEFATKEGPSAWKTRRIGKTNKVFLRQTLNNAISSNKLKDRSSRSERKERK